MIAFALYQLPRNKTKGMHSRSPYYWPVVLYLTGVFTAARFGAGLHILEHGNVIITILAAALLSLMLTPFFLKRKEATPTRRLRLWGDCKHSSRFPK